jgi:ketosteroid isomerase-like protein
MSQETVENVKEAIAHFGATGEPLWSTTAADIEVHDHDIPDAGVYRGHAGYVQWLEDWAGARSEFSLEPEEFVDVNDRVVVVFRMRATGRGSGVTVERKDAMVVEVRGGMAVRIDYYNNQEQALQQVGLQGAAETAQNT